MRLLTVDTAPAFLDRHCQFYDGVIRRAELVYESVSSSPRPDLIVRVEVKDLDSESGWCTLTLGFAGVVSFRVTEAIGTNVVMSPNGLVLRFERDVVLADFSPVTEDSYTRADFAASSFAVEAQSVGYEIHSPSTLDARP